MCHLQQPWCLVNSLLTWLSVCLHCYKSLVQSQARNKVFSQVIYFNSVVVIVWIWATFNSLVRQTHTESWSNILESWSILFLQNGALGLTLQQPGHKNILPTNNEISCKLHHFILWFISSYWLRVIFIEHYLIFICSKEVGQWWHIRIHREAWHIVSSFKWMQTWRKNLQFNWKQGKL